MKREFIGNTIKAELFAATTILTDVRPPVKLRLGFKNQVNCRKNGQIISNVKKGIRRLGQNSELSIAINEKDQLILRNW